LFRCAAFSQFTGCLAGFLNSLLPYTVFFKLNENSWDTHERGIMVFDFQNDFNTLLKNGAYTAELFITALYTEVN